MPRFRRFAFPIVCVCALLTAVSAFIAGPARAGASPVAQTVGPMVNAPWLDDADVTPAMVSDGGKYYAIVSSGSYVWHRWEGSSIDAMSPLGVADYSSLKAADEGAGGDDKYWLSDVWVSPDGTWYGFVHVEYDYKYTAAGADIGHVRRVVLATSTDQGATWQDAGDILTPGPAPASAPSGAVDFGDGDQRLVVDNTNGYLYLYYVTGYYLPGKTMSTGNPVTWDSVARCPMADIATPSCWTKWAGSWGAGPPGIGGADVDAPAAVLRGLTAASSIPMLTYDSGSGEFVAIGNGAISTATDLGAQNWTAPTAVSGALSATDCWYLWAFDPTTGSRYSVSQDFRFYGAGAGCDSISRYQQVNLAGGPVQETATSGPGLSAQDPWLYQYSASDDSSQRPVAFSAMTYVSASDRWQGSQQYCTVYGSDQQEPGGPGQCDAARTWRAPADMTVTLGASGPVTVTPCPATCGSGVELKIFLNGTQIWPSAGTPAVIVRNGGSYTLPEIPGISVKAGDDIEFLASAVGASNAYDNTTWNETVSEVGQSTDSYASSLWRYQYTTNLSTSPVAFSPMGFDTATSAWTAPNTLPYCEVYDADLQSPGTPGTCASARVWQAPYAMVAVIGANGPITVDGTAGDPNCGGNTAGVNLQIFHNGTRIWPLSGSVNVPNGGSYTFPGALRVNVGPGDDIEFVTSAGGTVSSCDRVTWDPTVEGGATNTPPASASFDQDNAFTYQYSTSDMSNLSAVTFHPMADNPGSLGWSGPTSFPYCDVYSASWQEPALGCASSRTWIAPYSTKVELPAATVGVAACPAASSTYNPATCSPGVAFEILKTLAGGGVQQVVGPVQVHHGGSATIPAASVVVNPGDEINFVTTAAGNTASGAANDNNWYDNANWAPVVTDPGPATSSYDTTPWIPEYSTDGGATYATMDETATDTWSAPSTFHDCTVYVDGSGINGQEPAPGCAASRTWAAPYSTTVTIGANGPITVTPGCGGNTAGVHVQVFKNGSLLWPGSGSVTVPNGGSYTFPSITANVRAGDRIEFVTTVNGSSNWCDNTTWDPTVAGIGHASLDPATDWYASATALATP